MFENKVQIHVIDNDDGQTSEERESRLFPSGKQITFRFTFPRHTIASLFGNCIPQNRREKQIWVKGPYFGVGIYNCLEREKI